MWKIVNKVNKRVNTLAEELLSQIDEISKEIDDEFEAEKDDILSQIAIMLSEYADELPPHYKWVRGDEYWDCSGELKEDGIISKDISLSSFLDEYTGEWIPTFESGRGRDWETYTDILSSETINIGEEVMARVLNKYIPNDLNEDEKWELRDKIHDEFYDNTKTNYFFYGPGLVFYVYDIPKNIGLLEFVKRYKKNLVAFTRPEGNSS